MDHPVVYVVGLLSAMPNWRKSYTWSACPYWATTCASSGSSTRNSDSTKSHDELEWKFSSCLCLEKVGMVAQISSILGLNIVETLSLLFNAKNALQTGASGYEKVFSVSSPLLAWAAWQLQHSPTACRTFQKIFYKAFFTPCLPRLYLIEVLALMHESRILRQWSNPVSGSRKSQASSPWSKQHRA